MTDDLQSPRERRARRLRRLGVLGLALVGLTFLLAPFAAAAEPAGWSDEARAEFYVACAEQLDDPRFCACTVNALVALTPEGPQAITEAKARAALAACPRPAPRAPELKT